MANGTTTTSTFSGLADFARAISALSGTFQRAGAFRAQSRVLEGQARLERQVAKREAMDFRRRSSRLEASARARRGASGVVGNTGTPLRTQGALAGEIELGALDILNLGAARATQLENSASLRRFGAQSALVSGAGRAGSTLITEDFFDFASGFFTGDEEPIGLTLDPAGRIVGGV